MPEQLSHQIIEDAESTFIQKRLMFLQILLGVAGLIFIFESWSLWLPTQIYPHVPFFSSLNESPEILHHLFLGGMTISLLLSVLFSGSNNKSRVLLSSFVICALGTVLLNQHRLQAWMYQLMISACILAWANPKLAFKLLRIFIISIYFYSAISKMDVTFPELTGRRILNGIFKVIDYDAKFMDPRQFRLIVYFFPMGELLTAILLCFRRTRIFGLVLSICMHIILLLTFSPLGLNHEHGVLLWNIYFILQNIILFRPIKKLGNQKTIQEENQPRTRIRFGSLAASVLTIVVIFIPLFEPWGFCDHWPAWGLYASRQERVRITIHETAADKLDESLKKYLEPVPLNSSWRRLRIHQWSLEVLKAPIYPQDRFQIGVALAVGNQFNLGDKIRVEREGIADRWTGKRSQSEYTGMDKIHQNAKTFRLNALPSTLK